MAFLLNCVLGHLQTSLSGIACLKVLKGLNVSNFVFSQSVVFGLIEFYWVVKHVFLLQRQILREVVFLVTECSYDKGEILDRFSYWSKTDWDQALTIKTWRVFSRALKLIFRPHLCWKFFLNWLSFRKFRWKLQAIWCCLQCLSQSQMGSLLRTPKRLWVI